MNWCCVGVAKHPLLHASVPAASEQAKSMCSGEGTCQAAIQSSLGIQHKSQLSKDTQEHKCLWEGDRDCWVLQLVLEQGAQARSPGGPQEAHTPWIRLSGIIPLGSLAPLQ